MVLDFTETARERRGTFGRIGRHIIVMRRVRQMIADADGRIASDARCREKVSRVTANGRDWIRAKRIPYVKFGKSFVHSERC